MVKNFNALKNRRTVIPVVVIISILLILLIIKFSVGLNQGDMTAKETTTKGFAIMLDNKELGIIQNKSDLNTILNDIENDINVTGDLAIHIDKSLFTLNEITLSSNMFTPINTLKKTIKNSISYSAACYKISVNGEDTVYLKTKEEAEEVIDKVKTLYLPKVEDEDQIHIEAVNILEDIKVEKAEVLPDKVMTGDDALKYLLKGTMEDKIYEVKQGDSLWAIAQNNEMTVDEIIQANPKINPTLIHIGDKINLIVPKPYLNVEVKYQHTYIQNIPYRLITKKDATLPRNKWQVEAPGKLGKKEVTAEVVLKNGLITSNQVLKQSILSEPVTKIVVQGTKRLPDDELAVAVLPEGMGIISSRFGMRWGRHHNGVDIAVPTGTPVYAYMGGTVTYSGWKSTYGKLIIIDHGNGYETYYAHNSKLLVSKGDTVSKRTKIALSGNTGRSTGPHVHLEIHKDGNPLNPITYLKNH